MINLVNIFLLKLQYKHNYSPSIPPTSDKHSDHFQESLKQTIPNLGRRLGRLKSYNNKHAICNQNRLNKQPKGSRRVNRSGSVLYLLILSLDLQLLAI